MDFQYIYSKTYNYVYLRAKSIMNREADVQQLMKEVYLAMLEQPNEIKKEEMYEWLGKCVYTLGCRKFRKKKAREADFLELDKEEIGERKPNQQDDLLELIQKNMEGLPDLYQATMYAFYYDFMSVEDIAKAMDCEVGIIINRLNYIRKYMIKVLEDYQEEKDMKVSFTVELLCMALRKWSVDHCLGLTTAQQVYTEICKTKGLEATSIQVEGKEFAGVNNTVVYHKSEDMTALQEQFDLYEKRSTVDKKKGGIILGIALLLVILVIGVTAWMNRGSKKEEPETPPVVEENEKTEPEESEPTKEEEAKDPEKTEEGKEETTKTEAEYILPESNVRKLTREDLQGLTKEQLRLARNEIFARHGAIFGVEDLDQYFRTKSWYEPKVSLSDFYDQVEMSLIEEANLSLIQEVESGM